MRARPTVPRLPSRPTVDPGLPARPAADPQLPARPTVALRLPAWLDDAVTETGHIEPEPTEEGSASGVLWRAGRRRFVLDIPEIARYLVADGNSIVIDPVPGVDPADVERLARSTPLAALCYQRGMLVFHAAAVSRGGLAQLVAGDSSAGKSMLLAELLGRGWQMLTDDLAPVILDERAEATVLSTYPELDLWPGGGDRLAADAPWLRSRWRAAAIDARPDAPRRISAEDRFAPGACRVQAIWWLSAHNRGGIECESISGADAFSAVTKMTYNSRVANALLDPAAHLRTGGATAATVPIRRLLRPRGEWTAPQLADVIEAGGRGSC